jgi:dehydrogenase/reductase SDR family protein 12
MCGESVRRVQDHNPANEHTISVYRAVVASYTTTLTIHRPIARTFGFVSDFRNAAKWDPRTYAVEKTTDGPIGVGTRFVLTGGMMTKSAVQRLHLPESVAGMPLPYDVVAFDAPNEFVLEGETGMFVYSDRLEFSADGDDTILRYFAELKLKRLSSVGEPLLRKMFQRIGDGATAGLPAAVVCGT